jgi:oxygen-dependent protoporphyrinogen oxidase
MQATRGVTVAVVGGGVTGLTAAWALARAGHAVRVFEAGPRLGGSIRSERSDGWLVEAGPASIQDSAPEARALVKDLGLASVRVEASPEAAHRFLVRGGRLEALPTSPPALLRSRLLSVGAKLRVLGDVLARPRERSGDVSVAEFMADHFGREVVERIVQPGISGIYAGDPARLSGRYAFPRLWEMERSCGSLLRAQAAAAKARRNRGEPGTPAIFSFRDGLQTLTDALAAQLPAGAVVLNAPVGSIRPAGGGRWSLRGRGQGQPNPAETFDAVVLALPAWALADLEVGDPGVRPLAALEAVVHPPVASVFLGYRREQVAHPLDGFGVLVPAVERRSLLGVLFSSTLFAGRAPDGHVALTALVGGVTQADLARRAPAELVAAVREDLRDLLGVAGEPAIVRTTLWPRAIPQYDLGYGRMLEAMTACERAHPCIHVGGSARDGISLPQCLQAGLALARRVARPPATLDSTGA